MNSHSPFSGSHRADVESAALDIAHHRTASLTGVYLMGFYNVAFISMLGLQASNTSGATKKSFGSVSIAIWYCKWFPPNGSAQSFLAQSAL